jgi:hypothetical protein
MEVTMRPLLRPVLAALLLLIPSAALAQMRPVAHAGPLGLPYPRRSLDHACAMLGFDPDQHAAARALYDGYRAAYRQATIDTNKADEEASKDAADFDAAIRGSADRAFAYIEKIRALEKSLLSDVHALCTPDQAARFPAVERARRREIGLRIAFCAGEGIDLPQVLDALKLDRSTPAFTDILNRWELDADRLLIEKDRFILSSIKGLMGGGFGEDPEARMKKLQEFVTGLMKVSGQVRDTNRRAIREIEPLLTEAQLDDFRDRINLLTFPRIWGPAPVEKSIDAALRLGDLSPEQRPQVQAIRDDASRLLPPIKARMAAAAETMQARLADNMIAMSESDHEDESEPFYAIRREKRAIEEKLRERLDAALTQEQRGRIPKDEDGHGGREAEFFPDFGEKFEKDFEEWAAEEGG